jgi:hypothetical protein
VPLLHCSDCYSHSWAIDQKQSKEENKAKDEDEEPSQKRVKYDENTDWSVAARQEIGFKCKRLLDILFVHM